MSCLSFYKVSDVSHSRLFSAFHLHIYPGRPWSKSATTRHPAATAAPALRRCACRTRDLAQVSALWRCLAHPQAPAIVPRLVPCAAPGDAGARRPSKPRRPRIQTAVSEQQMSSLDASVAAASLDLSIPWTALRRVYAGANGESNKKLYFQEVARRKGGRRRTRGEVQYYCNSLQ